MKKIEGIGEKTAQRIILDLASIPTRASVSVVLRSPAAARGKYESERIVASGRGLRPIGRAGEPEGLQL